VATPMRILSLSDHSVADPQASVLLAALYPKGDEGTGTPQAGLARGWSESCKKENGVRHPTKALIWSLPFRAQVGKSLVDLPKPDALARAESSSLHTGRQGAEARSSPGLRGGRQRAKQDGEDKRLVFAFLSLSFFPFYILPGKAVGSLLMFRAL
jgi:hypothetical protein